MRYAIHGLRPGEVLYTNAGRFQTSPEDGGIHLTDTQKANLEAAGYTLRAVGAAPEPKAPAVDPVAQAEIAANAELAQKVATEAQSLPKPRAKQKP